MTIELGPFRLQGLLGRGAMGEVWRGEHVEQGTAVAVKVLAGDALRRPRYRAAFAIEVRAVAGLHHPGVVMVLDYGEVDAAAGRAGLQAGSPFLVMELATGGALDQVPLPLSWPVLKAVLLSLLDALAHAHARGVIHRDLKPANVLISTTQDARPGLKLTDFGIAHALDHSGPGHTEQTMGTPHYMAPEQIQGLWRDYGPWTDLYALGCMAWELVCGEVPFDGDNFAHQAYLHLSAPLPAFRPLVEVPAGFEGWLRRLLAKRPQDRFLRAADAAWSLEHLQRPQRPDFETTPVLTLGASVGTGQHLPMLTLGGAPLALLPSRGRVTLPEVGPLHNETMIVPEDALLEVAGDAPVAAADADAVSRTLEAPPPGGILARRVTKVEEARDPAQEVPPTPKSWRRVQPAGTPLRLLGAGLGLYGLRAIPLVGRVQARDLIWEELVRVRSQEEPRVVVLQGAAGVGKSRLVEWCTQRAHELGSATVLKASHSPVEGPADGLPRMLGRHLRCVGLDLKALRRRVEEVLDAQGVDSIYERLALAELMRPGCCDEVGDEAEKAVGFSSSRERFVLVRRMVERLTLERPVVIWLDDVQWGADSLEFAQYMLDSPPSSLGPVFFLITARDEALAERPREAALLADILGRPQTRALELGPLEGGERAGLVQELLGLEGELAEEVERRTAGNPLFAVQLVGDWVQRGVLEVGEHGFALRDGASVTLPDDLHQVWRGRIERLLERAAPDARQALEVAAALGLEVDADEWRRACAQLGVAASEALVDQLMIGRLARPTDGGWAFVHAMLRESLERGATDHGRLSSSHLACARALEARLPRVGLAERVGHHYVSAGHPAEALDHLLTGVRDRLTLCRFREADEGLRRYFHALGMMGLGVEDPRWGHGEVIRTIIWRFQARFDEALALAEAVEGRARAGGWRSELIGALRSHAALLRHRGRFAEAEAHFTEALTMLGQEVSSEAAQTLRGLADIMIQRGDLDQAEVTFLRGLSMSQGLSDGLNACHCLQGLGRVARRRGRWDEALEFYQRAFDGLAEQGNRLGMAGCLNSMGDIARFQGEDARAEVHYREAMALYDAVDSAEAVFPRLNLGLSLLRQGRYGEARPVFDQGRLSFEQTRRAGMLGFVHTTLATCAAGLGDWGGFDAHMGLALEHLERSALVDPDIAWPAELAGQLAIEQHQPERARAPLTLALEQWTRLGKADEVARLRSRMASVPAHP